MLRIEVEGAEGQMYFFNENKEYNVYITKACLMLYFFSDFSNFVRGFLA